jgi:hypothetical protein
MQTPASLVGYQVVEVSFNYQTTLDLFRQEDSPDAKLIIFTPFVLRSADGTTDHLDPETSRAALAPVIDLFDVTIAGVTVDGDETIEYDDNGNPVNALGTLTVDFANGARLTVPPAPVPYDSWLLDFRDHSTDEDDEPERHFRPRLPQIRLRRGSKSPARVRHNWNPPL